MGWTTAETGFNSKQRQETFLFSIMPRLALGPTQPPIKWVLCILSLGIKQRGCEDALSPPPAAKVTNGGDHHSPMSSRPGKTLQLQTSIEPQKFISDMTGCGLLRTQDSATGKGNISIYHHIPTGYGEHPHS
jgi:hypothetical protein